MAIGAIVLIVGCGGGETQTTCAIDAAAAAADPGAGDDAPYDRPAPSGACLVCTAAAGLANLCANQTFDACVTCAVRGGSFCDVPCDGGTPPPDGGEGGS